MWHKITLLILFVLILTTSNRLSAAAWQRHSFTGLGVGAEVDHGAATNFMPTASVIQGSTGLVSYFGSIDAGYRSADPAWMARATVEVYYRFAGLYSGLQSNASTERAADYGFPFGIALGIPEKDYIIRLHVGAIIYTAAHANELQISLATYFRIW